MCNPPEISGDGASTIDRLRKALKVSEENEIDGENARSPKDGAPPIEGETDGADGAAIVGPDNVSALMFTSFSLHSTAKIDRGA